MSKLSKIIFAVIIFLSFLILPAMAQCPPWAQQALAELQQQYLQAANDYVLTMDLGNYLARAQAISAQVKTLPPDCQGQSTNNDKEYCRQLRSQYDRCVQKFKYDIAAGKNPAYTCYPPNCSY